MKRYLAKGHRLRGVRKDLAGKGNSEHKSPETGTHSGMLSYSEICAAGTKRRDWTVTEYAGGWHWSELVSFTLTLGDTETFGQSGKRMRKFF